MIRDHHLLKELIADLHFHGYFHLMGSDFFSDEKQNLVFIKRQEKAIYKYVDDVFIDYFIRTQVKATIDIPKGITMERLTPQGRESVNNGISLNLCDIYDRCTFVECVSRKDIFRNNELSTNKFINSLGALESHPSKPLVFKSYILNSCPILYLDDICGRIYAKYDDYVHEYIDYEDRTDSLLAYIANLLKNKNELVNELGFTKFGLMALNERCQAYESIRKSHIFGQYDLEDILFLYCLITEKYHLYTDSLMSFILFCGERNESDDNIMMKFRKFEKEHKDYHEIEPFLNFKDLCLRFTSRSKSKAFSFTYPSDGIHTIIKRFNEPECKIITKSNTLLLPYLYNQLNK